ncbi:unnamed protein product [Microthlaspi erraticum]|uniref:Arabidopsis retrotransposon Orf1 C-terminal domain-containing protein n=1 Tax=Microthlaspi erraticum TaxID=1685480 RepID=A0A6D2HTW5_9BRAS|nr:unnamed protein product [Microthlaspi erraticum]CAA7019702.1 unnamed protein product [Microthlaspi erraticum]
MHAVVNQLRSYQNWASRNRGIRHKCELRMGGLITPLLRAVGFSPDMTEDVAPPEELDLEYLKNSVFLKKTPDDGPLLYQFFHLQFGASRMLLPNPSWTTIRGGSNVEFNPPQSALYTPSRSTTRNYATLPATTQRYDRSLADETMPVDEFDHFHFPEYTTTARQSTGLKAAHKRISLLQRWNRTQDKITNKLKNKIKKMADQIKAMQDKLSCVASASRGVQRIAVGPRPVDLSEDEVHHDTTGGRPPPPDPPCHSSFEQRQQRKRQTRTCHSGDAALFRDRRRRRIITLRRRELHRTSTFRTAPSKLHLPPSLHTHMRACRTISTRSFMAVTDAPFRLYSTDHHHCIIPFFIFFFFY